MTSKILRADGTTELASIKSVAYHESVNADIDLRPGCVASSYIEVTCFGAQSDAPSVGEALTYYQVVGETETLIGIFYAEPSIPTKNSYSFVACDAVHKLDADFSAWLSAHQDDFPYTVYQLVSQTCTISGVTLGTSSWEHSTMSVNAWYADSITCRNVLQYAAEIACKFVRCNTSGEIVFDWYKGAASGETNTASGTIATFDDGADRVPLKSLTAQINPVQSGSGNPSPDNVRPISGWTGVNATRASGNLAEMTSDNIVVGKYIDNDGTEQTSLPNFYYSKYIPAKPSTEYTMKISRSVSYFSYMEYDASKGFLQRTLFGSSSTPAGDTITITTREDTAFLLFGANIDTTNVNANRILAIDWDLYEQKSLSISWQDAAGTVYGGSIVINEDGSADLTVDHKKRKLSDFSWAYTSGLFRMAKSGYWEEIARTSNGQEYGTAFCTDYAVWTGSSVTNLPIYSVVIGDRTASSYNCFINDPDYTDASTWLADRGSTEICYLLSEPLTYHFDNVGQLTTLLGKNNIWATTGDVTVEYYYQLGRIYPTTGTFNDEECYAYKQDGLTYDNYDTSALARVAVHPVGEDEVAYYYPTGVTSGNTLDITNNALLYGASAADMTSIAQTVYDGVTFVGQYRPMNVNMFPNECPFRSGQIVPVTDAQGVSFTTAIMSKVVTDSAVTLASTGREVYGDYALDTAKKLVQLAADIVRINKLKVDWAEIDQIFARDITVTGQLHSEDYSYTDGNIYANQGMGMDFGEKRYNTPNFGITPDGNVYAQGGKISGFNIQKGEYEEVTPSAPTYTGTGYTYADGYLEVTEDGTATFDVPLTATVGGVSKPLTRVVYQCYYGQPSSIPSTFRYSFYYLDSGDNPISGLGGMLEYEPYDGTALRSVIPNANYLSQSSSLTFSVQIRSGSACRIYYQYGNYYSLYTENGEIGTGATNVYVGDDGISVGEEIILTPDGNAKIYSLDLTDTAGIASPDDNRLMKAKDIYDELSQKVDTSLIPFAVSDGGSGQTGVEVTSTVSDVITASTNYTVTSINFSKWGKVAQLTMKIKRSSAVTITALTAVATLKSGYRPAHNAFAASPASAIDKCYVNESGVIYATGTFAANTEYSIFSTFILP